MRMWSHGLGLGALSAVASFAMLRGSGEPSKPMQDDVELGGIVTLYAHDDIASTFSFETGGSGAFLKDGEAVLAQTQLVFNKLVPNELAFNYLRREFVDVLDLGNLVVDPAGRVTDPGPRYPVSVFQTLFLEGVIFGYRGPIERTYRLSGYDNFVKGVIPEGVRSFQPQVGHTYVVRCKTAPGYGDRNRLIKLQVIDFIPDSQVTFRWAPLN